MKNLLLAISLFFYASVFSQTVSSSLEKAWQQFYGDEQMRHGIASLHVINAKTGAVVFSKNAQVGLAPASTQKIITSASAFELLGKDYRYKTSVHFKGSIIGDTLKGDIFTKGNGDPTFGSWRWEETGAKKILASIGSALKKHGVRIIQGELYNISTAYETQQIPDGWIWQDVGNYYGAGPSHLIWHENQYDLILSSGNTIGDPVEVVGTEPQLFDAVIRSELTSAAKGTGDNAYIYLPVGDNLAIVRGTIPINESRFKISGAMYNSSFEYRSTLHKALTDQDINFVAAKKPANTDENISWTEIYNHQSPSLDSIIYWFNRRSINLYGEAFLRTMGQQLKGYGSTDSGIAVIRELWKTKGIDEEALNMRDGSGLSPLNRVTTHAQVEILKYAKARDWYPAFYHSLPEYNGMKMKSGTISDVKGFCGYHQAKDGTEYIFSFLVNNYSGKSSSLVGKMYRVLDVLK